jgi:hypothetical protein
LWALRIYYYRTLNAIIYYHNVYLIAESHYGVATCIGSIAN